MYFDFEEHRPDTPRVPSAISLREGVLVSIIVHMAAVILVLLFPGFLQPDEDQGDPLSAEALSADQEPLRFVEVMPLSDMQLRPERPADASDQDRQASTPEPRPDAANLQPFMRGNTPEMVEGGPKAAASPPSTPAAAAESTASLAEAGQPVVEQPVTTPFPNPIQQARGAADVFRDVGRYLRDERFDNPQGGQAERQADIQFDTMGVDFGWWLRRFKNQVERNWIIPSSVMMYQGRVVVRFVVLENGTLVAMEVLQPAGISALTTAAVNALKLSNPTASLPPEYPADRMPITVTFHYNEDPRVPR